METEPSHNQAEQPSAWPDPARDAPSRSAVFAAAIFELVAADSRTLRQEHKLSACSYTPWGLDRMSRRRRSERPLLPQSRPRLGEQALELTLHLRLQRLQRRRVGRARDVAGGTDGDRDA